MKKHFELLDNRTGKETPFKTSVDVSLDENNVLTFEFDCKNSQLYSAFEGYNTDIYMGDVVEAFLCVGGDLTEYYEIEVAPNNSVFFQKIINPGTGDDDLELYPLDNIITSSVEICGNDYKAKFSIPLDKIGYKKEKGIKLNIFRIETEGGIRDKNLISLSPTLSDTFHDSSFFVEL
ncbi:MAG: hypothetical protein IJZ73_05720 [Clostridia bacterium]|nr:hypothetical protein [Clostridia bacterium]